MALPSKDVLIAFLDKYFEMEKVWWESKLGRLTNMVKSSAGYASPTSIKETCIQLKEKIRNIKNEEDYLNLMTELGQMARKAQNDVTQVPLVTQLSTNRESLRFRTFYAMINYIYREITKNQSTKEFQTYEQTVQKYLKQKQNLEEKLVYVAERNLSMPQLESNSKEKEGDYNQCIYHLVDLGYPLARYQWATQTPAFCSLEHPPGSTETTNESTARLANVKPRTNSRIPLVLQLEWADIFLGDVTLDEFVTKANSMQASAQSTASSSSSGLFAANNSHAASTEQAPRSEPIHASSSAVPTNVTAAP